MGSRRRKSTVPEQCEQCEWREREREQERRRKKERKEKRRKERKEKEGKRKEASTRQGSSDQIKRGNIIRNQNEVTAKRCQISDIGTGEDTGIGL